MVEDSVREHVAQLNRCNQRGGRMLSLLDLIDAGTVSRAMAAYLAAAMRGGASHLVGANPGGAGKTTVMAALLNWVPDHTALVPTESEAVLNDALRRPPPEPSGRCYVAHEIGAGSWYAYVWGASARAFFALRETGYAIATNLHADTLSEAVHQLVRENRVAEEHLAAVDLKLFLRVERTHGWQVRRRVSHVYESDGRRDRLVWSLEGGEFVRLGESELVTPEAEDIHESLLDDMARDDVRLVEDVRRMLLAREAR